MQSVFEAISDPQRRKILDLLKGKEMSVGELQEHFSISGASLSHHLNKLKSAGLVLSDRRGQSIYYSIHTSVFEDASKMIVDLFQIAKGRKK
ncbi:MAG: autorepressor SdpR family transcription factor [Bdellovibrionales bacterium]|nr:autorepressor SdpR family transcription factor [Bdellovibrionales bacterium]